MAKRKKRKTKRAWRFLKFQIVLISLVLLAIGYYFAGGYAAKVSALRQEAVSLVAASSRDTFRKAETSVVYDAKGNIISYVKGEKDVYYKELSDIPAYARQAMVSMEDKKFYKHHGVDYRAIVRAIWAMFQNGRVTQGASTITQQLARDVFLTNDKTWERKIEELYIAVELEKKYSKDDILEFYLNNIYFKNGYYGIEAASQGYFGKSASQLTLSEICFLCAIPNNPSRYNPLEHFESTVARRDLILSSMLEDRLISESSYYEAIAQPIVLSLSDAIQHNYMETYTYYCATRVLMELDGFTFKYQFTSEDKEKKYNEEYEESYNENNAKLFTGGYRIYTSLDMNLQQQLQTAVDSGLAKFTEMSDEGVYALQGAAVCIDNENGMVRAIVGGRSQETKGYTLNRAYQSYRQPGSSIKPLIVYTPWLERGYTADSMVLDVPIEDGPSNADGTYLGAITLRRAVELSRNTVAWAILDQLTPDVGLSYLREMNFARLDKNDNRLAIALGGFTNGVSPLEMAKAYATIENSGGYRNPGCILRITDSQDNVIYQADQTEVEVYKVNAARAMTDILEGVMINGTARNARLSSMPCAGKTGTTNDNKDGWFVGYTPYYTTSVWVGYDTPKKLPGLTGSSYPASIWKVFMTSAHQGLAYKDFLDEPSIEEELPTEEDAAETQDTAQQPSDGSNRTRRTEGQENRNTSEQEQQIQQNYQQEENVPEEYPEDNIDEIADDIVEAEVEGEDEEIDFTEED